MTITAQPLYVRFFINAATFGHSESYALNTLDYPTALIYAQQLLVARVNILPASATIEWAVLAQGFAPYAEQCLVNGPLSALPQWGAFGHACTGLLYRFETLAGNFVNRLFKPIDEAFIVQLQAVDVPVTLPSGIWPLPTPITLATTTDLFLNCFTSFRDLTCRCKELPGSVGGVPQYELTAWNLAVLRKVSSKNSNHRWRRVSWESQIYANAPAFTPCGEAVSVLHSCYYAPCIFYAGGTAQRIHYYWAKDSADVFPLPHIFWGRARAKQIVNSTGPGELTGAYRRSYSKGVQWGTAAGDHYTGAASDFLGQTALPWTPETPTPAMYLPACDFPHRGQGGLRGGGKSLLPGPLKSLGGLAAGGVLGLPAIPPSVGGLNAGGIGVLWGILGSIGGLASGGKSNLTSEEASAGGLDAGGESLPLGNLQSSGGLSLGGVSELVGHLASEGGLAGGAAASGSDGLMGMLDSSGGLLAGGEAELPGELLSEGGLVVGGESDLWGMLPSQGGLGLGGASLLPEEIASLGGLAGGGKTDLWGQLTTAGGLAGGGKVDLWGQLITAGGLAGGGKADLWGQFTRPGGLAGGGKADLWGQFTRPGGLAGGGKTGLYGQLASKGGLVAGGGNDVPISGNAIRFTGLSTSGFRAVDTGMPSGTHARSIGFWAKLSSAVVTGGPIYFYYGSPVANSPMTVGVFSPSSYDVTNVSGGLVSGGTANTSKHLIIATYDGTTAKIYIDGNSTPVASGAITINTTLGSSCLWTFGTGSNWPGTVAMQDVRVFNRVITTTEIAAWWNSGVQSLAAGPTSGLTNWWKTNSGNATTAVDSIGGNNGTLTNATWIFM